MKKERRLERGFEYLGAGLVVKEDIFLNVKRYCKYKNISVRKLTRNFYEGIANQFKDKQGVVNE